MNFPALLFFGCVIAAGVVAFHMLIDLLTIKEPPKCVRCGREFWPTDDHQVGCAECNQLAVIEKSVSEAREDVERFKARRELWRKHDDIKKAIANRLHERH